MHVSSPSASLPGDPKGCFLLQQDPLCLGTAAGEASGLPGTRHLGQTEQRVSLVGGRGGQGRYWLPPARGSSGCCVPSPGWATWLRVLRTGYGGGGKGGWRALFSQSQTLRLFLLLQLHREQSHIQHGDCGDLPAVWIHSGSWIQDVGKDFGIKKKAAVVNGSHLLAPVGNCSFQAMR